ncbi:hypothetical protein [Hymenobacter guriensis]|uniref:DUF4369 domain-containing protein n=1 Tax=Hymenobacter guriensis TaxID=2793065 RepID=A0ABS0L240_9BACT|nr:hypothetical protein [Hymenobacter guriensis]MBG8554166.1 hypothetical protein [Hymenobacter guriensis]
MAQATTWDEPWQDQVVKGADHFVLAKVTEHDEKKGLTVTILRSLDGSNLAGSIAITDFYLLDICSTSGGHGPEFHVEKADTCYFFLKKNPQGTYSLATPTTGFATVRQNKVAATYRHSYHQALVPQAVYEPTMTAIFNHYHGKSYDATFIKSFLNQTLALPPATINEESMATFFLQHAALETIYHLGLTDFYALVQPFLRDSQNFHAQISAARALTPTNTPEAKQQLLALLKDKTTTDFTKTVAVWTLAAYKPIELKPELQKLAKHASTEENGFGGNIMDPRVCTHMPSVKDALAKLTEQL